MSRRAAGTPGGCVSGARRCWLLLAALLPALAGAQEASPRDPAPGHCWTVQVGFFGDRAGAEQRSLLTLTPDASCAVVPGDDGYAVQCGCMRWQEEAEALRAALAQQWPDAFVGQRPLDGGVALAAPALERSDSPAPGSLLLERPVGPAAEGEAATFRALVRRPDERRPDSPLSLPMPGGRLVVTGELDAEFEYIRDLDLGDDPDDERNLDAELELELFYSFGRHWAVLLEGLGQWSREQEPDDPDGTVEREWDLRRGETWLYSGGWLDNRLALQLGRQNFYETRQWWWDANLDSARLYLFTPRTHFELGAGQELAPVSRDDERVNPEDDDVVRVLGRLLVSYADDHRVALYGLYRHDRSETQQPGDVIDEDVEDEEDADLGWLGLRLLGEWDLGRAGDLAYWLDGAGVAGTVDQVDFDDLDPGRRVVDSVERRDVRGWAVDVGLSYESRLPGRLALNLGYARGSGDSDPDDHVERSFRQTGVHDNESSFRGESSFKYYGELLDPELSNLQVFTAGIGVTFLEDSSLDLVFHQYRQVNAADRLRDAELDADPDGLDPDIGRGLDLILAVEEWDALEFEVMGSVFEAGDAFGDDAGRRSARVMVEVSLGF